MTKTERLVALAEHMGLTPIEAIVLPTVIEVAARPTIMGEIGMINEAMSNAKLRDYLASICRRQDVIEAAIG